MRASIIFPLLVACCTGNNSSEAKSSEVLSALLQKRTAKELTSASATEMASSLSGKGPASRCERMSYGDCNVGGCDPDPVLAFREQPKSVQERIDMERVGKIGQHVARSLLDGIPKIGQAISLMLGTLDTIFDETGTCTGQCVWNHVANFVEGYVDYRLHDERRREFQAYVTAARDGMRSVRDMIRAQCDGVIDRCSSNTRTIIEDRLHTQVQIMQSNRPHFFMAESDFRQPIIQAIMYFPTFGTLELQARLTLFASSPRFFKRFAQQELIRAINTYLDATQSLCDRAREDRMGAIQKIHHRARRGSHGVSFPARGEIIDRYPGCGWHVERDIGIAWTDGHRIARNMECERARNEWQHCWRRRRGHMNHNLNMFLDLYAVRPMTRWGAIRDIVQSIRL